MTTKAIIKICGLSTAPTLRRRACRGRRHGRLCVFRQEPAPCSLDQASALARLARGRAEIAALTVDASDEALSAIIAAAAPDYLQLHGRETPQRVAEIARQFGLPTIKAIGVSHADDLARAADYADIADRLLFDAKAPKDARLPGGNGVAFDWRLLAGLDLHRPYLLSGGLDAGNVAQAIAITGAQRRRRLLGRRERAGHQGHRQDRGVRRRRARRFHARRRRRPIVCAIKRGAPGESREQNRKAEFLPQRPRRARPFRHIRRPFRRRNLDAFGIVVGGGL